MQLLPFYTQYRSFPSKVVRETIQAGVMASANAMSKLSTVSFEELSKHRSASDCWISVNAKVYDVSSFLPEHPGGLDSTIRRLRFR